MINRERLLEISELKLAGKIEQMEEGKLANYVQLLNSFIDNLPGQAKKIKDALEAKNHDALKKHLSTVRDMLKKINADEMAQDCTKQINWLGSEKPEKIEAYMRYFLSSLSILSADIQKAQQQADTPPDAPREEAAQKPAAVDTDDDPKKITVKRLLEISELKLAGKIEQMEEDDIDNYIRLLDSFTENFPEQEENIKNALKAQDNDAFTKHLSDVRDILEKIYAEEMAQDCTKQINAVGGTSPEKIEAYMRYFLSTLSMLSIDIQMAQQKTGPVAALPAKSEMNEGPKTDKRILAVDDTAFFLTILKKILQDTRYKLTCVTSGREALKYLEKNQPDIFLLDIEMPGMDGYELAAKIKESGHKAPIIFLTGNARKEYLAKAVEAGGMDFIIKPINKDILLNKIRKYVS